LADFSLLTRETVITELRAWQGLLDLVPVERIFGMTQVEDCPYPFTRYGVPILTAFNASCIAGSAIEITLHAFHEGDSEDEVTKICAEFVDCLDSRHIPVPVPDPIGEVNICFRWTGGQTMMDPLESRVWHGFRTFAAEAI